MQLQSVPNFNGQFTSVIGLNSPFYIRAQYVNMSHFKIHLYVYNGMRSNMVGINPIITLERKYLNQYSGDINISPYLINYVAPNFGDIYSPDEWNNDEKWVCWSIQYYNNNTLINTYHSNAYIATFGWCYEKVGVMHPHINSLGVVNNLYMSEYDVHSTFGTKYNPATLNYFNQYELSLSVNNTTKNDATLSNLTSQLPLLSTSCNAPHYDIMFINATGVWQNMPLGGKVTHNVSLTKETYNRNTNNYNYYYTENRVGVSSTTSTQKYTWITPSMHESMILYIENIIHSPMIVLIDLSNGYAERVYIKSCNYAHKTFRNDKRNMSYTLEFESMLKKIK